MSAFMFDSYTFTHQFKLNFLETVNVAVKQPVSSEVISAGGHLWRVDCYPRGVREEENGEYVSISLKHMSESKDAKATFEAFVMKEDGTPSSSYRYSLARIFLPKGSNGSTVAWPRFVKRSVLLSHYVTGGSFIIMCGVKVELDELLVLPPSDIGSHLGLLLDCTDGSDVLFIVDGEKFPAHRAVLAARSPVFKAQLLGSMADAKMPSITMHDIAPSTFKVMLHFMYTDACPADSELGNSPDEMFWSLLAAADRFALDRLKILCAVKLWDNMSVDTVVATLICAETYNCPQLKNKCIDFIAEENNFKRVVLTDGFVQLVQQSPSILHELREKVGAQKEHACIHPFLWP